MKFNSWHLPGLYGASATRIVSEPVYLPFKYTGADTILVADAPFNPGKCQELNFIDYSKKQKQ